METSRKKLIEVIARDDAKWDKCFVDLTAIGYVSNTTYPAQELLAHALD